jgi:hypothetical protein
MAAECIPERAQVNHRQCAKGPRRFHDNGRVDDSIFYRRHAVTHMCELLILFQMI